MSNENKLMSGQWVFSAYLLGFLLPIVGVIMGIYALFVSDVKSQGFMVIGFSCCMWFMWSVIFVFASLMV
jgi:hypothetical protein